MKLDKTSGYILGIVGIVALVGIVVMIMNNAGVFSTNISGQVTSAACGDGTCVSPENSRNCPADCGTAPTCGDGTCVSPETPLRCPADCGAVPTCGDGTCDSKENVRNCPTDCRDADTDGVPDSLDVCAGYDDSVDADKDGVPDGCDVCTGYDDSVDTDADSTPDGCDLPDLVLDAAGTSVYFAGKAWVNNSNGDVINQSANATVYLSVMNEGTETASGTSYNDVDILYSGSYIANPSSSYTYFNMRVGSSQLLPLGDSAPLRSTTDSSVLSFLQEIYDSGTPTVTISYDIDYASTLYIVESDESNNEGTYDIAVGSSQEDVNFICVEFIESGDTTYSTAVETTCTH